MSDNPSDKGEGIAVMIATAWHVSSLLGIPFEDACSLVMKWLNATTKTINDKKRLS